MLALAIDAPFAVCRHFTAGWNRPTAPFLTPSAVYGLLLNIACLETRLKEEDSGHDGKTPSSLVRPGLPRLKVAIGIPETAAGTPALPRVQTILQQLHNYPVGKDAGIPPAMTKGNKNNISPVRREVLSELRALIRVEADTWLLNRIEDGLQGKLNAERYGLPFLGDNQFLIDRIALQQQPSPAFWYRRLDSSDQELIEHTARFTIWIDRADMSRTSSALYAPTDTSLNTPPDSAWTEIAPP
jgi:CRISPR-associated protein Cas5t